MSLSIRHGDVDAFRDASVAVYGRGHSGSTPSKSRLKQLMTAPDRDVALFSCHSDGQSVGRIMVHAPRSGAARDATACFAHFDCADDPEIARALLDIAASWARARGLRKIIGHVGLADLPDLGVVTDGFAPHIARLLAENGFASAGDMTCFRININAVHAPDFGPDAQAILDDPAFTFAPQTSALHPQRLTEAEAVLTAAIGQVAPFALPVQVRGAYRTDPALCGVLHHNGRPVACCLGLPEHISVRPPSIVKRAWPMIGQLARIGWSSPGAVVMLTGVLPQYQHLAIGALLWRKCLLALAAGGYATASTHCTADLKGLDTTQSGVSVLQELQLFSKPV